MFCYSSYANAQMKKFIVCRDGGTNISKETTFIEMNIYKSLHIVMVKTQIKTWLVRFYNEVFMYNCDIAIPIYTVILLASLCVGA